MLLTCYYTVLEIPTLANLYRGAAISSAAGLKPVLVQIIVAYHSGYLNRKLKTIVELLSYTQYIPVNSHIVTPAIS
jgi:hypothetical protein